MCIAILKPKEKSLTESQLRLCFENNPDGAGFAYCQNNQLCIEKGFMTFEEFWSAFNPIQNDSVALVHFRIATSGNKDAANCHPWPVNEDVCLIHNGTITDFVIKDSAQSDSGNFATFFVAPLLEKMGPKAFLEEMTQLILMKVAGAGNKVVLLDKDGDYYIVNEKMGEWNDGVWYSNGSYKEAKKEAKNKHNKSDYRNHRNKQPEYRYSLIDSSEILTSKEITQLLKEHSVKKIKKLVKMQIIKRWTVDDSSPTVVKYGGDGRHALETHWDRMAALK